MTKHRRHRTAILLAFYTFAASASAQTQRGRPQVDSPSLLISAAMSQDSDLGRSIAELTRHFVQHRIDASTLYVIPARSIQSALLIESPPTPWPETDVRALGRILRATSIVEVGARRSPGGRVRLSPLLFFGRADSIRFEPIDAADAASAAAALTQRILSDSIVRRRRPSASRPPANDR
jgi:hypothetical protein